MSFALVLTLTGCEGRSASPRPTVAQPQAKIVPKTLSIHGHDRVDNYYWLNDREDEEVIAYLEAENDYLDSVMAHTDAFRRELFDEIKGRIKEDDSSVPYHFDGYYYYRRYEETALVYAFVLDLADVHS